MPQKITDFKHIVALGGGHGLGRLLSALQFMEHRLTGIVATSDNGGSSGRLRRNEECIAWGDLRNCINQLVTTPSIGSRLFEYRYEGEGELAGHNLGNLILLALDKMSVRPLQAINLIRNMLKVKSHILPMSETPTDLLAFGGCGTPLFGETSIDAWHQLPASLVLSPEVRATPESLQAIAEADLLLLGPGSFLTSLLPPLLIRELAQALGASSAPLIFISNLVHEQGPSGQLTLAEQLAWIGNLVGRTPDGVLTETAVELELPDTLVYSAPLAESGCRGRHDREKLVRALESLCQQMCRQRQPLQTQCG